ncbi:PAS domain-containing sensor histidine kinase [Dactylosporangium salmoneum]|uniref:Sensor-like histidine kinase SenX3 n=1 Tax=Dactylosporangium salmoneum TaxID=53361 RepID=A0ABP5TX18_9ACTN
MSTDAPAEARHDPRVGTDQLLALIDHTSAVVYMRDPDGRYMLVNREYERLFDVRRENIVGLTDHDLFPAEIADAFRANDLQAVRRGAPIQLEEIAPGDDGPHTYITVKFPLMDSSGAAYAVCGISTDITARKRAEERVSDLNAELEHRMLQRDAELESVTRQLDTIANAMSNDLRRPLLDLRDATGELARFDLDPAARPALERIRADVARMTALSEDLHTLLAVTQAPMRRTPVDLSAMAASIVAELPDRGVVLDITPDLRANCDAPLTHLLLQQLLRNAWRFAAGRVQLTQERPGGPTVFVLRDDGPGFDPRLADQLFEPFQKLHPPIPGTPQGNGIGLAIAQRAVQRHGGRIWADTDPGAVFRFTLAPERRAVP